MPNFVDAFLQALPQGAQNAQRQLQLMLEEERIKDIRKKEKQEEDAAQAMMLLGIVRERDALYNAFQLAASRSAAAEFAANPAVQDIISSAEIERRTIAEEKRVSSQLTQITERALQSIENPQAQEALRGMLGFAQAGVKLTGEQTQQLYPSVFPKGVDPSAVNAALRLALGGGLTWGEVRRQLGIPMVSGGIPDDFAFPAIAGGATGRLNDRMATATMHHRGMTFNNDRIKALEAKTGGISIPAQAFRVLQTTQSSSGGVTGLLANLLGAGVNWSLSPEQQQLVQAQLAFSNHYRFMISGMQSSDREFIIILNSIAGQFGDSPEVLAQKEAFRDLMTQAAAQLAQGKISPVEATDRVIAGASGMNLTPDMVAVLEQHRKDAARFQVNGGVSPPYISRDPNAANQELLLQLIMGVR